MVLVTDAAATGQRLAEVSIGTDTSLNGKQHTITYEL